MLISVKTFMEAIPLCLLLNELNWFYRTQHTYSPQANIISSSTLNYIVALSLQTEFKEETL